MPENCFEVFAEEFFNKIDGGLNWWTQHFILEEKMECRDESTT